MASTPFMKFDLPVPGPGGTPGPTWAFDINSILTQLDSHDHTTDQGQKITPLAMNINADLTYNNNALTSVGNIQLADLTTDPGINRTIYPKDGELYFEDGLGNIVQITSNGAVNVAGAGSIGGDYGVGGSIVTYTDLTKTYSFFQSANTLAKMVNADISIGEAGVTSPNLITIASPSSLAAAYNITLPTALPASGTEQLLIDNTGQITTGTVGRDINAIGNAAASQNVDFSLGEMATMTLTQDTTLTFSNQVSGQIYNLVFTQDGTGGWAVTYPGTVFFPFSYQPAIDKVASSVTQVVLISDGTNLYVVEAGDLTSITCFEGPAGGSESLPTTFASPTLSAPALTVGQPVTRSVNDLTFPAPGKYICRFELGNLDFSAISTNVILRLRNTTDGVTLNTSVLLRGINAPGVSQAGEIVIDITDTSKVYQIQWAHTGGGTLLVNGGTVDGETSPRWRFYFERIGT